MGLFGGRGGGGGFSPSPGSWGGSKGNWTRGATFGSGGDGKGFSVGGLGTKSGALGNWDVLGKAIDEGNPILQGNRSAQEANEAMEASLEGQRRETTGVLDTMSGNDMRYLNEADKNRDIFQATIRQTAEKANKQATDARAVYTGTVQPELKNIMEGAREQAGQAMTLQQAGDPNNSVQTAVRDLYNKQGEAVRKQGHQDFGVLSALGAQAAGQQFGAAGPMTAGMQGQIYAANQSQAGEAYARAQQQMNRLREQGIDAGFRESDRQYQRGESARDRYANSVANIQSADEIFQDRMGRFRDEGMGYGRETYGLQQGSNAERLGILQGQENRKLGMLNNYYGGQQAMYGNQAAAGQAQAAGGWGVLGSVVGSLVGGAAGGRGGAAAGGVAGAQAGQQTGGGGAANYGTQNSAGGYYDYGGGANYPARPGPYYSQSPGAAYRPYG